MGEPDEAASAMQQTIAKVTMHALCRLAVDQPEVFAERAQWCLDNRDCLPSYETEGDILTISWATRPLAYLPVHLLRLGSDLYIETLPPVPDDLSVLLDVAPTTADHPVGEPSAPGYSARRPGSPIDETEERQ